MPSGRTNNFPESGRGLGHVTPTIFGSTVGYPSDSLASCVMKELYSQRVNVNIRNNDIARFVISLSIHCHFLSPSITALRWFFPFVVYTVHGVITPWYRTCEGYDCSRWCGEVEVGARGRVIRLNRGTLPSLPTVFATRNTKYSRSTDRQVINSDRFFSLFCILRALLLQCSTSKLWNQT